MKTFGQYLNDFKALQKPQTDEQVAKHFGVTPQYITNARRIGNFSDERCIEIARALDVPEYEVMISRNVLKESGDVQKVWSQAAKRLGGILAIGAAMILGSGMTAERVEARIITEFSVKPITQEVTQVYDFLGKSGIKDYRKYKHQSTASFLGATLLPNRAPFTRCFWFYASGNYW